MFYIVNKLPGTDPLVVTNEYGEAIEFADFTAADICASESLNGEYRIVEF